MSSALELATLGGGCFWCLEAVFSQLQGVQQVVSGYTGGETPNPTYEKICSGKTGHAEVVQITFDPTEIGFDNLLDVFFTCHNPTTLNRQGADVGTQYRSVIYYHNETQRAVAEQKMREIATLQLWPDPLVTQLQPSEVFYPAEAYHQSYFAQNPYQPYCQAVVAPKVAKVRQAFFEKLKKG